MCWAKALVPLLDGGNIARSEVAVATSVVYSLASLRLEHTWSGVVVEALVGVNGRWSSLGSSGGFFPGSLVSFAPLSSRVNSFASPDVSTLLDPR
jgi:hypothetical protein